MSPTHVFTLPMAEKKRKLRDKLTDKYRLVILNDSTFEEALSLRLSRLNLLAVGGGLAILGIAIVFVLIAYTPVRELIPGYPDQTMRQNIKSTALKLDSLEQQLALRDYYINNVYSIIKGDLPKARTDTTDTARTYGNLDFSVSAEDSMFRRTVEAEDQYSLSVATTQQRGVAFSNVHFFVPVKGVVTNSYNSSEGHYGIDVVAGVSEVVKATLEGTVVLATWSLETGYTIQIQHTNNLISLYKHNAELLKSVGSKVVAGEAIAIIGNSGELTTGPHLHFELWHDGQPLNPEDFMVF